MRNKPIPQLNNGYEIRAPWATAQPKSDFGNVILEARRAALVARRVFDSENLIRPTGDLLFKKMMTESPRALLDLINRIVKPDSKFTRVEIKNNELLPTTELEKLARLDVLAECDDRTQVDIEMQCGPTESLEQRAMFYAARVYSSALPKGCTYVQLPKVIVIFILEEAYFPMFAEEHHEFQMCRTWPPGKPADILSKELPSLHFVELGKLCSSESREDPILKTWLSFMLPSSKEEWDNVVSEDAMFSELKKKVEEFSASPELAMQQRAIDEGRMSRQIELAGAFHRGREEGREEACAEAKRALLATMQRMLAKGMSKPEICELQGISLEALEGLEELPRQDPNSI